MGTYNLRGRKTTSKTKTYDLRPKKSVTQTLPSAKGESVSSKGGNSIRREDYKTDEAYASALKRSELASQYHGLSYDQVQSEKSKYAQGTTEYDFFDQYTGYSSLADFDKAISAISDDKKDKLQIARNQYALDHASEAYKYLEENEDFEEKSQYVSTVNPDDAWWQDTSDRTYEFINDVDGARDSIITAWDKTQTDSTIHSAHPLVQKGLAYMNEDEVRYYNYLYATEGKDKANEFLDAIEVMLTKRATDEQAKGISDAVDGDPVSSIALSAVSIPMNVVGAPLSLADSISGNPYGYYSQMSNASSAIRQSVGDNIEEGTDWQIGNTNVARFLYDTGMSIGDSAVGAVSFGHALAPIMGVSAYQQKAKELKEAGESEDVIVKTALASGVAEALFEYVSVDKLLKIKNVDGWRKAVTETLKQMGIEGSEEVFTEVANVLADDFFRGDNSELAQMRDELKSRGFSEEEIAKELQEYVAGKLLQAGIGGALSGGIMGGVQSARQYGELKSSGAEIRRSDKASDMMTLAGLTPEESETYKTYSEYAGKGMTAETISDARLGNLHALAEGEAVDTLRSKDTALEKKMDAVARMRDLNSMSKSNTEELESYAKDMDEEKASLFISQYDGQSKVSDYIDSFEMAYAYGETGFGADSVLKNKGILTEAQASEIYKSAMTNKAKAQQKAIADLNAKYGKATIVKGVFSDDIIDYDGTSTDSSKVKWADLTSTQRDALNFVRGFSEATGINIRLTKSEVVKGKHKGANGSYNPDTNTIEIDVYAGRIDASVLTDSIIPTLSHEVTHWMKAKSPAIYNQMRELVMSTLTEDGKFTSEDLVAREMNRMRNAHPDTKVTEEMAIDELIARGCEDMLSNSNEVRKLLGRLSKDEQSTFIDKVKKTFQNLMNWVNELLGKYKSTSKEAEVLREYKDRLSQLSKMWDKALTEAMQTNQNLQKEGTTGEKIVNETLAKVGLTYDAETQSAYPATQFSERTWTESEYVQNRREAIKQLASSLGVSKRKAEQYIDNVNSIARMIAEDRVRLDYIPSEGRSAFVSNVEYGGSIDFSTLCKKRRLYTGTISAVQEALPNTALTPEEYLKIRSMLLERGYEATCGLCYVEGSRTMMGQYTKQFLEKYAKTNPPYVPTMAEMNTPEGQERIRFEHPEVYEKYVYFMNHYGRIDENDKAIFASQQKPKMYTLRTDYKHEIADKFKKANKVNEKNRNGGIRLQSFSDFEIVHLIDCMQVIMDMSKVGLAGQAYTKVVEFADALGNTGLKINLSLIAKGVDANGNLIFDDVEGMPHEEAMRLRGKYSKNVGTVVVVFNREQLASALRNPNIDYVLPFHRSQWKKAQYDMIGLPQDTEDFTNYQNEKGAKGNLMPNTYWDFEKTGRQNAEKYLSLCNEDGRTPKFPFLLEKNADGTYSLPSGEIGDNYFKLLIDFKMYDNDGKGSPQLPVVPNFSMEESVKMLNEYTGGHSKFPVAQDVVDDFVAEYKKENPRVQYSSREIIGASGKNYGMGVYLDSTLLSGLTEDERKQMLKLFVSDELAGSTFTAYDKKNNPVSIMIASKNASIRNKNGKKVQVISELYKKNNAIQIKQEAVVLANELVENAKYDSPRPPKSSHGWLDNYGKNDWDYWKVYIQEADGSVWEATLDIANTANGEKILYDIDPIKKVEGVVKSTSNSTNTNVTQNPPTVNVQNSDRDSQRNRLTEGQQRFFAQSKVRDENGRLKTMYHGTTNGGFHVFDPSYSDDGRSLFFTDNPMVAKGYSGTYGEYEALTFNTIEEVDEFIWNLGYEEFRAVGRDGEYYLVEDGRAVATSDSAKGLFDEFREYTGYGTESMNYKVYLNLVNPLVVNAEGRNWDNLPLMQTKNVDRYNYIYVTKGADGKYNVEWEDMQNKYGDAESAEMTLDEVEKKFGDFVAEEVRKGRRDIEAIVVDKKTKSIIPRTTRQYAYYAKQNGYDGVIFNEVEDNAIYASSSERFLTSTVAIAFDSNQVKSTANENPTEDKDIRYSDRDYMDAVERGDMETAQKMVDEVAKKNGYDTVVFHGTNAEKINVFVGTPDRMETNSPNLIKGYFSDQESYADDYGSNTFKYYINADNFLYIEGMFDSDEMTEYLERHGVTGVKYNDFISDEEAVSDWLDSYGDVIDPWMFFNENGGNITERIHEAGYKGVYWNEGYFTEDGGIAYMPFESNLIKSADTVTYDDEGNIIPLSKRFNTGDADVRYSDRDYGYHAGDLGKAEGYWNMVSANRGTGHFGTGTYFVGDEAQLTGNYAERPHEKVDFSKYNLFKPYYEDEGFRLHDALKRINNMMHLYPISNMTFDERYGIKKGMDNAGYVLWNEDSTDAEVEETIAYLEDIRQKYGWYIRNRLRWSDVVEKEASEMTRDDYEYFADQGEEVYNFLNDVERDFHSLSFEMQMMLSRGIGFSEAEARHKQIMQEIYDEVSQIEDAYNARHEDSPSTRYMKKWGYEGVDVRHLKALDNTKYGSVIYDLKGEDLARKQEIGTARYSDRDDVSLYETIGEDGRLAEENAKLAEDIAKLASTISGDTVSIKRFRSLADYLKKLAGSNVSREMLGDELKELYEYIQSTPDIQWNNVMAKSYDIARDIMNVFPDVTPNYFKSVMADIRKDKVTLSPSQNSEAVKMFGSYADFHKRMFGRVNIVNEGTPLTEMWKKWSQKYPTVFDANLTETEQIKALVDILDALKTTSSLMSEYEREEAIRHLATEVYNQFWNIASDASEDVKKLRADHRKLMEDLRKAYDARQKESTLHPAGEVALKYEQLLRKVKESDAKEMAKIKELGKKRMTDYKDRVAMNAKIEKITKKALTLNQWLLKNSKEEHIPEVMKEPVAYLLSAIDFSSKQLLGMRGGERANTPTKKDISLSKALEKVHDMVKGINDAQIGEDDISEIYGTFADFPVGFADDVKALSGVANDLLRRVGDNAYILNDMSLEQLEDLDRIITTIKSTVTKMNRFLAVRHAEGVANLSQQDIVYLDSLGKRKTYDGLVGGTDKMIQWGNATPYYAFKRFGEGGKKVRDAILDGWDKYSFHVKEIIDYTEQAYTSKEAKEWAEDIKEFDILVPPTDAERASKDYKPQYQKVQMSVPQIMALYCTVKRAQAKTHLFGGGMRVADIKGKKGTISQPEGAILTDSELEKITGTLTARQREVADTLQRFMNTTCSDWGNEVSMLRFGINQFGEENYFPIQSDRNNLAVDDETERNNSLFRLLNMSFTKSLTEGANNRIVIGDIFDIFAQHASDMAKYNALALPVLDAFKWYNYKEKVKRGKDTQFTTMSLKQSLETAFGKDAQNYITTFLKDINGAESGGRDSVGGGFFTNAKIASVGLNARVIALQPTSYVRANAVIDPKYLARAFTRKPNIKMAEQYCGIALWKSLGFFDINIQKSVTTIIKHEQTTKDKLVEASMKGAEMADKLTWGYLWNACEIEVREKNPSLVGEELYKKVGLRLREVIYSTQVVDSTVTRSQMMRSKDGRDKMITAFMSEPTLAYNMLQDTYYDWKLTERQTGSKEKAFKKHGKKMARVFTAYAVTNMVSALVEAGFDIFRDTDDEEITFEDFMKQWGKNLGSNMSILGKIPYAKEIISFLEGYSSSRTDTQWMQYIATFGSGIVKLFEGKGNAYKTAKDGLRAFSYFTGLPLYNAWRDLTAFGDKVGFEVEELEEMFNDTIGDIFPSLKSK